MVLSLENPGTPAPTLRIKQAAYRLDQNVLEFAFTVTNPSDSLVYVDCQGQPASALTGKALSEGTAWMLDRGLQVAAKPVPLRKQGKRPPPQKPVKVITPAD